MTLAAPDIFDTPTDDALDPIDAPYLLVTGIPCHVDAAGRRWTDALWHKDLVEHVRYLNNFTLAAPTRREPPPAGAVCLTDDARFANVRYVDLPASDSTPAGLLHWPRTFLTLWNAAGRSEVVHCGVADWPIPTGWAATLAARLRRRILLINIESAFWRIPAGERAGLIRRFRAWLWEVINRWCVRRATLALFTQDDYARELLVDPTKGHVFQASWIDEDAVIDERAAEASWDRKESAPLTILFAGRLIAAKGVIDLLNAVELARVSVDIIGDGDLKPAIVEATKTGNVRLLSPIPYGPEFFQLIRRYHAVVVPSTTDEQPRIVYDAYSQAVPVLGTRTPGIAACVSDDETGWLVEPGQPAALADLFQRANANRADLRRMGLRARSVARRYTHREMHRRRWRLLADTLRIKPGLAASAARCPAQKEPQR